MSFKFVKQLPSPDEVKMQVSVSEALRKVKEERDKDCRTGYSGQQPENTECREKAGKSDSRIYSEWCC